MLLISGNVLPAYFDAILRLQQVLAITQTLGVPRQSRGFTLLNYIVYWQIFTPE